ncbi:alanine-tRNA ligase [Perilla frutescens var. hirtella]|uniref:Alanine-tRNA ligase n=1 Tax=Perilla frutescens var. hirtella TaxID=608512 RepID=A0AAD4IY49_PERFH|nr:alanine-tRNA ligase [Perilla frutescens var. hirtella]KAH6812175.1 alanine-tRNA ligase [Perilla frutescens var. frutescens]KAH6823567.1 alanine-tRNA ligase [Perilla frutescens var. hirtella]
MSVTAGESSGEFPTGNPTNENITREQENIPWTEYALQQAQIAQKTIESTVENAIETTRSRVDRILTTSSAHLNQTIDSLQDLKSDYSTYEDIAFGKIKEGFLLAYSHPLITTGAVVGVGVLGLKKTRQFLSYKTMRLFLSEETLLSRADTKVKELRQSIELLKGESEKLEKRALQAEEDLVRGRTKLRQAGKQIQGVISSAYKIERQARGLKDALTELPSREASRFRTEVTNLAKEAKKERNALSKEVTKISNHGISV